MNKTDLIEAMAEAAGISKSAANRALEAFTKSVTESLQQGEPVVLTGFGTFIINERAARSGRNPSTGKHIEIPAAKVARFRVGKKLKEAVNANQ